MKGYPFRIIFWQYFTDGLLKGVSHKDSFGVLSQKYADDWVRRVNSKNRKGKLNYHVTSYEVVPSCVS